MSVFVSPEASNNGLVFCLDANNIRSYAGTGTTWSDMGPTFGNGTLYNSPTFSNGSFAFNGSNQYCLFPNSTALDTQTPTVEVWARTNATTQNGFWFEKGAVNTQYSLFQEGTLIQWRQRYTGGITNLSTTTATYLNTANWFQVVGTYTSGSRILYINGVRVNSDTQSGAINTNSSGISVGSYYTGGYFYNGNIAIVRIYNRVLTPMEVYSNFNGLRYRFGI